MDWTTIFIDVVISIALMLIPISLCIIGEVGIGILLFIAILVGIIANIIIEFSE
jgi:hypothetical protein